MEVPDDTGKWKVGAESNKGGPKYKNHGVLLGLGVKINSDDSRAELGEEPMEQPDDEAVGAAAVRGPEEEEQLSQPPSPDPTPVPRNNRARSKSGAVKGSMALRIYRSFSRAHDDDEDEEDAAGNAVLNAPLTNLDQLYTQARGADVLLKEKVKAWALVSNGLFPIDYVPDEETSNTTQNWSTVAAEVTHMRNNPHAPAFIKWSEAIQDPSKEKYIKWGKIKTVDRAIEKLLRSYKTDVSRLLDVCRQSIVFESIGDLCRCLGSIRGDADIQVVRIKNRMEPSYDSTVSAGYRDVVLNMRITSKRAVHLRVDTHVCELQLMLRDFAEMKHDQGHKRYKQFRDTRGE